MLRSLRCLFARRDTGAPKKYALYVQDGADRKCVAVVEESNCRKALIKAMKNLPPELADDFKAGKVFSAREHAGELPQFPSLASRP